MVVPARLLLAATLALLLCRGTAGQPAMAAKKAAEPDNVVISVGVDPSGVTTWFMATKPDEQLTQPVAFLVAFTQQPGPASTAGTQVGFVSVVPAAAAPAAEGSGLPPSSSTGPIGKVPTSITTAAGGPAAAAGIVAPPAAGGTDATQAAQPLEPAGTSVQLQPLAPDRQAGPVPAAEAESTGTAVPAEVMPGLPGVPADVAAQPAPAPAPEAEAGSVRTAGPEGWTPRRATIAPTGTLAGGACLQLTNSEIAGQVVLGTSAANSSFDCCSQMLSHSDANAFSFCPVQQQAGCEGETGAVPASTCLLKLQPAVTGASLTGPPPQPPLASQGANVPWISGLLLGPRPGATAAEAAAAAPAPEPEAPAAETAAPNRETGRAVGREAAAAAPAPEPEAAVVAAAAAAAPASEELPPLRLERNAPLPESTVPPLQRPGVRPWPAGWSEPPAAEQEGQCVVLPDSNPAGDVLMDFQGTNSTFCCDQCAATPGCNVYLYCPALPGCPDGTGGTLSFQSCYLLSQRLKGPANETSLQFLFRGAEQSTGFVTAMHAGFVSAASTAAAAPAPEPELAQAPAPEPAPEEVSPQQPPAKKLPRPILTSEPSTGPLVAPTRTAEQPQAAQTRQPPLTLPQSPPPPAQEAAGAAATSAGVLDQAGAPAWPGAGWSAPPPAQQQSACAAFPQSLPAGDVIVSYNTPRLDVCCWRCAQEPQCSAFAFCPADSGGCDDGHGKVTAAGTCQLYRQHEPSTNTSVQFAARGSFPTIYTVPFTAGLIPNRSANGSASWVQQPPGSEPSFADAPLQALAQPWPQGWSPAPPAQQQGQCMYLPNSNVKGEVLDSWYGVDAATCCAKCVADPACTAWGYCGDPAGCNNGYGGIAPPNSCGTKFLNTTTGAISEAALDFWHRGTEATTGYTVPFLSGYVAGRVACTDVQPPDGFTCQQQAEWGKCGEAWVAQGGFCRKSCGRC